MAEVETVNINSLELAREFQATDRIPMGRNGKAYAVPGSEMVGMVDASAAKIVMPKEAATERTRIAYTIGDDEVEIPTMEEIGGLQSQIDTLNNGGLTLKDEMIAGQVKSWLNAHPEASTTVTDRSITKDKISKAAFSGLGDYVNVASCVDGELTSGNIAEAIRTALTISRSIFIPKGSYAFTCEIADTNLRISLDPDAIITTSTVGTPVLRFTNCNVQFIGGQVEYRGADNPTGYPAGVGQSQSLVEFVECDNVVVEDTATYRCDYTCVFSFKDCGDILVERYHAENLMFAGLHQIDSCRRYIVRNCYCKNVRIPSNDGVYYSYFSYTGSSSSVADTADNPKAGQKLFQPPEYVLYENNYCENCADSTLDSHGATIMRAIGNTCINCNLSITLYDDSRRCRRPEGFRTKLVEVVGNRVVSDYWVMNDPQYNTKQAIIDHGNEHPGLLLSSSGTMHERLIFRDNYIKVTANKAGTVLNVYRTQNAIIENCHIESQTTYAIALTGVNKARIANCDLLSAASGTKRVRLNGANLTYEGGPMFSTDITYANHSFSCVHGSGYDVETRLPAVMGGEVFFIYRKPGAYLIRKSGLWQNPYATGNSYLAYVSATVTVSGNIVTGLAVPSGGQVVLTSADDTGVSYTGHSETVWYEADPISYDSTKAAFKIVSDGDQIPDGTYTLTAATGEYITLGTNA